MKEPMRYAVMRVMSRKALMWGALILGAVAGATQAQAARIENAAAATEAAKRYLKARCNAETPCTFKPEREGNRWRVWVRLTKRNSPNQAPQPYPGGTVILFFDLNGNLIRRLEGD
jgi:hypothetical protein